MELDPARWGSEPKMSAWEAVMWRAEGDLRTRSSGALVELLDGPPDWERLAAAHARACAVIPRLRERVVEPLVPVGTPIWVADPHFDLAYHLARVRLPEPGTMRQLLDYAAQLTSRPLDENRPPWEATVVEGMEDGRAAYILRIHHSMADGLGFMQLLSMAHSRTLEPGGSRLATEQEQWQPPRETTRLRVTLDQLRDEVIGAPSWTVHLASDALNLLGRVARNPAGSISDAVDYGRSLRRMLAPPAAQRSPLLRGGGFGYKFMVHDVPLVDLKAAGKAAGGSVNDAFLAALLGTFRRYHEHFGIRVDEMPIAIPISLRTSDDPMGGNRFAGARFVAPVGEPDPAIRIKMIRDFVRSARDEPAIAFVELLAPALSRLPSAVLTEVAGGMVGVSDFQASNIPGMTDPVYLAGARVLRLYPMGPRPGVAAMVAMVSYDGMCCVAVNLDPDAITQLGLFEDCLRAGFAEVLALGEAG
jgi:WS/DGAT/MGAT family acyltransferase